MIFIALLAAFITFAAFFVAKIVKATKAQTNGDMLKSNTTKNEDEPYPFKRFDESEFALVCGRDGFGMLGDE